MTSNLIGCRVYSANCFKIGQSSAQSIKIGYSSAQCIKIGYSSAQCIKIGYSSAECIKIRYRLAQCKKIGSGVIFDTVRLFENLSFRNNFSCRPTGAD